MRPFKKFTAVQARKITHVLTDIDDTLTIDGRLPACAYQAMEDLSNAGIKVVPITGRPAGWCDLIARLWPVDGVVGENGAFYFRYDESTRRMVRKYAKSSKERKEDQLKLKALQEDILKAVPGCRISADQAYREADLAVDFCEDVPPLPRRAVMAIQEIFQERGATAKISSIHVNGWFGSHDKLSMTRTFFKEVYRKKLKEIKEQVIFSGDSPNDEPMFAFFTHGVGVANILDFRDDLTHLPAWVTEKRGGAGFAEMAEQLLSLRA